MFNSLRARLWLSYSLLIGLLIALVATSLALAILRDPTVYRAALLPQLRLVDAQISPRVRQTLRSNPAGVEALLIEDAAARKGIRTALIDPSGRVIADSATGKEGKLPVFDPGTFPHLQENPRLALVRDSRRKTWAYWSSEIGREGYVLFIGTTLPRLPLLQLLRNEVAAPLIAAGLLALIVASLLAFAMGNWITAPLRHMIAASRSMAAGKDVDIPEQGPQEVQELARSLNRMHRQVRQAQISQRDFVANVSHELKTPLTSIQGFAQAILDGAVQAPHELKQAADVIYSESNRMYRLVLDLLTLARLEGGTADLQREHLDLAALLRNVATKFTPQAQAAQVQLVCQVEVLQDMLGDGDRLAQVFTNLVDNALKFSLPGGIVTIRARQQEGSVIAVVSDTGKGIDQEDQKRIFERFYQLDKSRRGGTERGVGLGLPIAREIVLAHGGKIWVESTPGQGSHFFVQLPTGKPALPNPKIRKS